MSNEIPRRNRLDLNTPAEKAIYDAIQEVEKAGADPSTSLFTVQGIPTPLYKLHWEQIFTRFQNS